MYTLTGSYAPANGSPAYGWVDVTPDIVAVADGVTIVQQPVRAALVEGSFSLSVIASDDPGWNLGDGQRMPYIIRETVDGLERGWMTYLDGTGGDVADLVPLVEAPDLGGGYLTQAQGDVRYVNATGDTLEGGLYWKGPQGGEGGIGIVPDVGGEALQVGSDEGLALRGPYLVLDSQSLHLTLAGGIVGSPLQIVGFDQLGGAILGWGVPAANVWEATDTTETPVTIKTAGSNAPTPWVSLGLSVTVQEAIEIGRGTIDLVMPIVNASTRTGELELGIKGPGDSAASSAGISISIASAQDSTVALNTVNTKAWNAGDIIELWCRVVYVSNSGFALTMDAAPGNPAVVRVVGT